MPRVEREDIEIEVSLAGEEEVGLAAQILEDAVRWAAARGFDSWIPGSFTEPGGWGRERLVQALEAGGLYLIRAKGDVVATMSLLSEDPVFWPGALPDALYLHRFAVREAHTGGGVGAAALAWADDEVLRRGRRFLRLDCLARNPGIRAYYERAGFRHRGDVEVNGLLFSLYEREARGRGHRAVSA